jgi:ammonia channel protein AmtB
MTGAYANYTYWTDFIFQAMFAATAATIVSGAVAERVKLKSFMIYAAILVTFLYPITGSWKWGYGWLNTMGFHDFAGSTLVHAFGGFAALAAVLVLGPVPGKYTKGRSEADSAQQSAAGQHRRVHAVPRLVRIQRRFGPQRRSRNPSRGCS